MLKIVPVSGVDLFGLIKSNRRPVQSMHTNIICASVRFYEALSVSLSD